jgi:hypothetical protein
MTRSNSSTVDLEKDNDSALGYLNNSELTKVDYDKYISNVPSGGINSSVLEMTNWLKLWINNGKFKDKEILPPSYVQEAISPQIIIDGVGVPGAERPDIHFVTYGFGWMMASYRGHYMVNHGGNLGGFTSTVAFYPTDSLGIVVLVNQNQSSLQARVRNIIADKILNLSPIVWNEKKGQEKEPQTADAPEDTTKIEIVRKPLQNLKSYEGLYTHKGYGTIKVKQNGDSLFAYFPEMKAWCEPYLYNAFIFNPYKSDGTFEGSYYSVSFLMNGVGVISSLEMHLEDLLEPIKFERSPLPYEVSVEQLKTYEGLYDNNIRMYIKDSKLYCFVPGQPDYELVPVGLHKFENKKLLGYFVEFEGKEKSSSWANFLEPGGDAKMNRIK